MFIINPVSLTVNSLYLRKGGVDMSLVISWDLLTDCLCNPSYIVFYFVVFMFGLIRLYSLYDRKHYKVLQNENECLILVNCK